MADGCYQIFNSSDFYCLYYRISDHYVIDVLYGMLFKIRFIRGAWQFILINVLSDVIHFVQ